MSWQKTPKSVPILPPLSLSQVEDEMKKLSPDLRQFLYLMKEFQVTDKKLSVSYYANISSMAWHPSSKDLLLAVGDKKGSIGNPLS